MNNLFNVKENEGHLVFSTMLIKNGVEVGVLELKEVLDAFFDESFIDFSIYPVIVSPAGIAYKIESPIIKTSYMMDSFLEFVIFLKKCFNCITVQERQPGDYKVSFNDGKHLVPYSSSYGITYTSQKNYVFYNDEEQRKYGFHFTKTGSVELYDNFNTKVDCTLPLPIVSEEERRAYVSFGKTE